MTQQSIAVTPLAVRTTRAVQSIVLGYVVGTCACSDLPLNSPHMRRQTQATSHATSNAVTPRHRDEGCKDRRAYAQQRSLCSHLVLSPERVRSCLVGYRAYPSIRRSTRMCV